MACLARFRAPEGPGRPFDGVNHAKKQMRQESRTHKNQKQGISGHIKASFGTFVLI